VASPDGKLVLRESLEGRDPCALGSQAAQKLLARGGAEILQQVCGNQAAVPQQP
jgi:hydroxymethylbilane synthase